jgi:hypothetical protein
VLFVDNLYAKMYCSLHMHECATIESSVPVFSVGGRIFENSLFCPNSKTEYMFFVEYISLLFFTQNLPVYLFLQGTC